MARRALWFVLIAAAIAAWLTVGCGSGIGPTDPTTDLTFSGSIEQGANALGFSLPAMQSDGVSALQLAGEELLGTIALTGTDAPIVQDHGTTKVPVRFSVVGMGAFVATRWNVNIVRQGAAPPGDTRTQSVDLHGRDHANAAFTNLSTGPWDTTLELYGVRKGPKGNLLFSFLPPTTLNVNPTLLNFPYSAAQLTLHVVAPVPAGADPVAWTAATSTPWLSLAPDSGAGSGDVVVTVDRTGLAPGLYNDGLITVSTDQASTTVDVAMEVRIEKIAFTRMAGGNYDVCVMNADGSGFVNVSNDPAHDDTGALSPDATKLAFDSKRGTGVLNIFVANADGSGSPTQLTFDTDQHNHMPTWSPDGTQIVYIHGPEYGRDVWVMDADGSDQRCLVDLPGDAAHPAWSCLAGKIAFASVQDGDWDIYTVNPDGTGLAQVTNEPGFDYVPVWSPDGTKIAYTTNRGGNGQIWVMAVGDEAGAQQLTNESSYVEASGWSPDGTRIVYGNYAGGGAWWDLKVVSAESATWGQFLANLTDGPGEDGAWARSWAPY